MRKPPSVSEPPVCPTFRRLPSALRLILWLALFCCLNVFGCGDSEAHQTLVAANERVNDLKKENARLEQQDKDLQAQMARKEADLTKRYEERLTSLKRDLDDRQARGYQLQEAKVAQLESTIASLRLELGTVGREKIALQGLVDRKPRIEAVQKIRSGRIEAVLGLFGGLTLIVLVVVGSKYRVLRQQHDLLVVQRAASSPIRER